ncbi:thiamin biosynthesis protein [Auricularia subglabra TFB-10046 SS5]|nr:thiamin biosynthesis protein [Auricularia subglabra TFB-10046 SS5]
MANKLPVVLTIAGTDPSGGAGIQADLKTFTAHGCFGTSAITALVAQNTTGVQAVHAPSPDFVAHQIRCVLEDATVDALKTGMLYNADTIRSVVETLRNHYNTGDVPPLVVDPVSVSTSGHTLLERSAVEVLLHDLLPLAAIVTPNVPEAELMLDTAQRADETKITSVQDMIASVSALGALGSRTVLLKGGHVNFKRDDLLALLHASKLDSSLSVVWLDAAIAGPEPVHVLVRNASASQDHELIVDVLFEKPGKTTVFVRSRLDTTSTHGTGCTLSASIACELAFGKSMRDAVRDAILYTHRGIETAPGIGKGHGPLNHVHSVIPRPLPVKSASNPFPFTSAMIAGCGGDWAAYVKHPFVQQLGKGTLPLENFKHFIIQDWHYLRYYARANGLLAAKSHSFAGMSAAALTIQAIVSEKSTHEELCAAYGVSQEVLRSTPESPATAAYGGYLLDVALTGDAGAVLVVLGSCLVGYGEVGLWLVNQAKEGKSSIKVDGNPYQRWIEDYAGDVYQKAVTVGIEALEHMAADAPPSAAKLNEYKYIWHKCTRLEKGFWDMAMALA